MKKLLYIFLFSGIIGCSSVKKAQSKYDVVSLENNLPVSFNGTFENKCEICEGEIYSLWSTINYSEKEIKNWEQLSVRITINNDNTLLAELIDDDQIINTRILKGEIEADYFQLNRQWKTNFKFIVLWLLGDSSVKLALNENKELVVLRESGGIAILVAFPVFGANSPLIETNYKRVE